MGKKKHPFTKTPSTNSPGTCTYQETHAHVEQSKYSLMLIVDHIRISKEGKIQSLGYV